MRIIKAVFVSLLAGGLAHSEAGMAQSAPAAKPSTDLKLADLVQRVIKRNENLQVKLLDFEVSRRKGRAEHGAFEPTAFASSGVQVDNRQNSSIQAGALLGNPYYYSTNITYEGGLESALVTGTRVHIGYTLTSLHDNLQAVSGLTNSEYQSFVGLNVTQPLLKNFGPAATMMGIRVAALASKVAFQEYRQALMNVVSTAEVTYWNLYLAQEQVQFFEDSVKTANLIVKDNQTRLQAGSGSALDVLEAESALALRQAKLSETRQKMIEAANQVIALYAAEPNPYNVPVRATDEPRVREREAHYEDLQQTALEWNPDYLIAQQKEKQEEIRLGYARNQRLPELNLRGGYGINGLGATPGSAWDNGERGAFDSWSMALEFRLPLAGDIKGRNEYYAAQLQVKSAEVAISALRTQITTAMDTAWHKLESARNSIDNYRTTVNYNQTLLNSALERLHQGKIESGKVLDVEANLLEAKDSLAEALVHYEVAMLELEVIEGALLQDRHLEITQEALQEATRQFIRGGKLNEMEYQRGLEAARQLYHDAQASGSDPVLLRHAGQMERDKVEELKSAGRTNDPSNPFPGYVPGRPMRTNSP